MDNDNRGSTHEERELARLQADNRRLDAKLATIRSRVTILRAVRGRDPEAETIAMADLEAAVKS